MNSELVDAARAWLLDGPLSVSALCDMIGHYLMTPLPVVGSCRIDVCDCNSLKPSLIWRQCEEPRDKQEAEFIASLINEPYRTDFKFPLQPLNELAKDHSAPCTYFQADDIDYVWADKSLGSWSLQPRVRHGASTVLLTLGKVPWPWNHDFRNDNWITLQWPFLIFSTLHRDGPLFAAHILDLRSDLKFCAALQVFFPFGHRIRQSDLACFLQQGCLFVGIHGREYEDGAPNRLVVFSLDGLVFSPKPVHGLRHKSLFAPAGHVFEGYRPGTLALSFQESKISICDSSDPKAKRIKRSE